MQLIYCDRKNITGCLGRGWWGKRDFQGAGGNFGGDDHVHYLNCGDGFMGGIHMSKSITLYTLNLGSLLDVNYSS